MKTLLTETFKNKFIKILLLLLLSSNYLFSQEKKVVALTSRDNATIVLPLAKIGNDAGFYSFKLKKSNIRFFAILDRQNKVHVAFDACDVCYEARKGYRVVNNLAVCNNCGNKYPLNLIGKDNLSGGCWPSYLPVKEENNNIVIKISDLERKGFLFP